MEERNILDILTERGLIKQASHLEETRKLLETEKVTFYIGFDPTADSLHVGHYVALMTMAHMQRAGHRPIALLGGGTAMIGDPSGKSDMRKMLTQEDIDHNASCFRKQMERLVSFEGENAAIMVNNGDWIRGLNFLDFMREIGTEFSVNRMLAAECYKLRMETGLTFFEMSYMLMQSYDFLMLNRKYNCVLEMGGDDYEYAECAARICRQFDLPDVAAAGLDGTTEAVSAAGALLRYIDETQKTDMAHIRRIDLFTGGKYMELDWATRRSLELTESLRTGEKRGSLLWVLDKTKTPMGGRELRAWIERPLLSPIAIKRRLSAVDELFKDNVARGELIDTLRGMGDMQRLIGRVVYGTANGRDLLVLRDCAAALPRIVELLGPFKSALLRSVAELDTLDEILMRINWAICDDPPFSVREGGILKPGYSDQVDQLRKIRDNGAEAVAELEAKERARTGIKKLKIGYNKVFGYFIDVPKSADEGKIPDNYIRKQTLVSNERYFTPELKELETTLLTAADKIKQLEYEFFMDLCNTIAQQVAKVQATAEAIAQLDVLCSFAEVAVRNDYCMPEIDASGELIIREGRHPVVEQTLSEVAFVPNDTQLNCETNRVAIVTGPNMAGKSTYMRQTALITLMAQIGSFVPAKSAVIGVVDRVFTRIGASDDLASGQSTFMLEMSEVANILSHATERSLLILDEIGRGTSTYDGMAIARAVLEYCADKKKLGAKTMFATHYHELSALEGSVEGVHNYSISAKKQGDSLVFLRKIVPGSADDSYGIEVAKLAGVPNKVISMAKTYLKQLEADAAAPKTEKQDESDQISLVDAGTDEVGRILRSTDINSLTPLEALNLLSELQQKARG